MFVKVSHRSHYYLVFILLILLKMNDTIMMASNYFYNSTSNLMIMDFVVSFFFVFVNASLLSTYTQNDIKCIKMFNKTRQIFILTRASDLLSLYRSDMKTNNRVSFVLSLFVPLNKTQSTDFALISIKLYLLIMLLCKITKNQQITSYVLLGTI